MAVSTAPLISARQLYWLLILPALILLVGFFIWPLLKVLFISVTEPSVGLDNYERLFTSASVQRVLITTLRICVLTTAITMVLGYLVAYAMTHVDGRHLRWMTFFVLLPFWISVLVRAFSWVTLLRNNGLINQALLDMGVIDQPLALVRNEFGVVLGMVHYMTPFAVLPLYANMKGIDVRLVAAARGLGASPFEAFLRVFLPLSMPGIIGAGVLVFIFSLGFYVTPAILGGGKTLMVAEYISLQITETLRWGLGSMLASTLLISVFAVLALLSRFVNLRRLFGAA